MKVRNAFYVYLWYPVNFGITVWTMFLNSPEVIALTLNGNKIPAVSHIEKGVFVNGYIDCAGKLILNADPFNPEKSKWFYFSSTMRDGAKGTRWIAAEDLFKHKERWEVREDEASEEDVTRIIQNANSIIPAGYDVAGLCGFASFLKGKVINSFQKWYCSETWYWLTYNLWEKTVSPLKCYLMTFRSTKKVEDF